MVDLSAVIFPDSTPQEFVLEVRRAEQLGLRGAWTYDHLSWRDLRDGPWHAGVPLLAAAAVQTTQIRLGFLVSSPNFRHPVPFAKDVMTLDHLSNGRLDLGVGAGGAGPDTSVLGQQPLTPTERADRFEDFVRMLETLLENLATTGKTGHFEANDARMVPGCVQRPHVPLTIAALGPRGLKLAAELGDGWVSYGPATKGSADDWYDGLKAQNDLLGNDTIRKTALVGLDDYDVMKDPDLMVDRLAAIGFDEIAVHWPRHDGRGATRAQIERLVGRTCP